MKRDRFAAAKYCVLILFLSMYMAGCGSSGEKIERPDRPDPGFTLTR